MPARLRDLRRALTKLGAVVTNPGTGSHFHILFAGRGYTIPAHNADKSEISDTYIKGMCRSLGIDEKRLRELL